MFPLSSEQAESILHSVKRDKRSKRGVVIRCLDRVTRLVWNAVDGDDGIGSIPSGERLYQLKISLLDFKSVIWRRIQVTSRTLDKFHEHIQTATG